MCRFEASRSCGGNCPKLSKVKSQEDFACRVLVNDPVPALKIDLFHVLSVQNVIKVTPSSSYVLMKSSFAGLDLFPSAVEILKTHSGQGGLAASTGRPVPAL